MPFGYGSGHEPLQAWPGRFIASVLLRYAWRVSEFQSTNEWAGDSIMMKIRRNFRVFQGAADFSLRITLGKAVTACVVPWITLRRPLVADGL